jgi:hypothetical protein
MKLTGLVVGATVGVGAGAASHVFLPPPAVERQLDARGIETVSDREAIATIAPMALVSAAAIGTGIGRRSQTAAVTTASLGAAAMLASTGASTMINAERDNAGDYLRTLGLMCGVASVSFAIGAMDEVPLNRAKMVGLAMIGLSAGALAPATVRYVADIPPNLSRSVEYRNAKLADEETGQ